MIKLFTTTEWEKARPSHIVFTQMSYTADHMVRRVRGYAKFARRVPIQGNMVSRPCCLALYWDGLGQCYLYRPRHMSGQHRMPEHDIPLP